MASSRTETPAATASPTTFALQEVTACWNQGYEALVRGDLERVAALLEIAGDHLPNVGSGHDDNEVQAAHRRAAAQACGRLEHAMRAGLDGLQRELARTRHGGKALRGYADPTGAVGTRVRQDA